MIMIGFSGIEHFGIIIKPILLNRLSRVSLYFGIYQIFKKVYKDPGHD